MEVIAGPPNLAELYAYRRRVFQALGYERSLYIVERIAAGDSIDESFKMGRSIKQAVRYAEMAVDYLNLGE